LVLDSIHIMNDSQNELNGNGIIVGTKGL
jgi:hypothetical protein